MRVKLDENLPVTLCRHLRDLGHNVDTTRDENLSGKPDLDIWRAAQTESRLLITQDLDFSDIRKFRPGQHHGILLVRLQLPHRRALIQRVVGLFQTELVEEWGGCVVVATDRKVRVVRGDPVNPT